ncbi:molybdenum cofactor guanylyltransferase [Wansuia hejianensis]|uniref:Probable molybdenum cofactor guanylyltransferase n=1 Tax=Wansuia hejianensis TaxID=2763667 RepID=A0A926F0R4_9FIRM|nr:molybdenum cofactor guanylyltransferase [Wansuia hejianensis]MBC8590987.1 molybdenum cofactor guanylyltransferase [Wansuia hejianensis]
MKEFGTAIILAGGKSSRMGFDKQFLKIEERRLIDSIINKLKQEFQEIIIVTNKPEHYIGLGHKITKDILKDKGPLGGIHAGLSISSSKYALVVACDMPNVNIEYIKHMKEHMGEQGCYTKIGELVEPFCSFYSKDIIKDIERYLETGRRSTCRLVERLHMNYIEESKAREFSPNWDMFLNLNTKEDLNNYLEQIAKEGCI